MDQRRRAAYGVAGSRRERKQARRPAGCIGYGKIKTSEKRRKYLLNRLNDDKNAGKTKQMKKCGEK